MELKPGYKQTELGPFPDDWRIIPISACLLRQPEYGLNAPAIPFDTRYPTYLRITDITDNGQFSKESISSVNHPGSAAYLLRDGEIVFARTGASVGKSYQYREIDGPLVFAGFLIRVSPDPDELIAPYLFQFMRSHPYRNWINENSMRSGQPGISANQFLSMLVPVPGTEEQEAIAEGLSDVDGLIESLGQLVAKKLQIRQGAMEELLTGSKRLPGFSGNWTERRLGEMVDIDPENLGVDTLPNYSFRYISLDDVNRGRLNSHSEQTYISSPSRARRKLKKDDVLVSTVRPNLMSHLHFTVQDDDWVCSTGFSVIRCQEGLADPFFIYSSMFSNGITRQINTLLAGSNYPAINSRDVKNLRVLFPEYNEQVAIVSVLSDMDAEILSLETKLIKARQLKVGMMQELLTGKVRLVQPESRVVPFRGKEKATPASNKGHNSAINEAVIISVLAKNFGSVQFPLGRKRYTKLSYLFHRHAEGAVEGYLEKAAGPYNPSTKYKGAEKIALSNKYVRSHARDNFSGFVAAEKIAEAEGYFSKWYGDEAVKWLEQFRYKKNDELELLATVDMAMGCLREAGKPVDLVSVRRYIHDAPEWTAKLNRSIFSDDSIDMAIKWSRQLFEAEAD